ncbi:mucin-like protein 3 [Arvicanthis niloticus]|uniref:mucin-like protein 3 n=1 Tax=Arvicanthis niloticus TaxID=61156 RepID=UPI00148619CA|nr:mucin-like protein 3 [Arvicanthis niloticus]
MAQLTSVFYSISGFFICLLFLPASWEAGANTFQELQKTGEPTIFDHLPPLTPGLTHRAPSDHKNSGQHPPDLPESTAPQKPKKQCNTARLVKPVHKTIDSNKATDYGNTTVHHETPPASGKNLSSQGKHPIARNERSADDSGSSKSENRSDGSHSTSAPRRSTTCRSSTRRTRATGKSSTPVSPIKTSTRLRTTSQKPTTSHDSESIRKSSSPVKSTEIPKTSYKTPKTPTASGAEHHTTTFSSDKSVQIATEHIKEATSAREKTTRSQSTSTEYGGKTGATSERTSQTQVHPAGHQTASVSENVTQVSAKSTKHPEEATSTTEKAPEAPESPTVFQRKTTVATKTITTTETPEKTSVILETTQPVKATEDKSTVPSPHSHKTETIHQGITGSLTSTMDLRPITSEAHHPQQNTHSLPGGLHAGGERGENNSFPAWAIVVVILMAVIILLIFLGLIFLVSFASRARHVLTQNPEDAELEDRGGRNSYPVYLMEQQNLKPNQIPSPP